MKEKIIKIKTNGYSTGFQLFNSGSFQLPCALTSLGSIHISLSHHGFVFADVTSCQLKGCAWTCIYSYPVPVAGQKGVIYTTFPLSLCHTSHCQVCSQCPALPWILHFHLITSFIAAISRWWIDDFFFFFFVLFVSLLNAKTYTYTPLKKPSLSRSPPILPSQS